MKKLIKKLFKLVFSLITLVLCAAVIAGTVFGIMGYHMYKEAVEQNPVAEKVETIRHMDGFTSYEQLPDIYIDAVISAEDRRFWSHHGIDLMAIGRAVWNDIRTFSFAEGGSTITQQLAKNLYFTQEKKLERKFAEIFAAFELESQTSKEEILELYVNTIYFGSGYYGIYEAAQGYFGKEPWELDDYESVMLAGLPNAPSAYSPDKDPSLAEQRMEHVLKRMVACGTLTQQEANAILLETP